MRARARALLLLLGAGLLAPAGPALAQRRSEAPLEDFVEQVARLWMGGDVDALVELIPSDQRLLLDTGSGTEIANSRHAAAALRALFSEGQTVAARAVRSTLASERPPRGFGELDWTYRARGAPAEQSRSIYVAALLENGEWRIAELRVMR